MSVRIKDDVSLRGLIPQMSIALTVIASQFHAVGLNCIITSGTDGRHKRASAHYTGRALDFRTWGFASHADALEFAADVKAALGRDFDVVLESDHLHVEWDPKGEAPAVEAPAPPIWDLLTHAEKQALVAKSQAEAVAVGALAPAKRG
jgi:hypothetical protein